MSESLTAARPYAKALYEIAKQDKLESWLPVMQICKSLGENAESRKLLNNNGLTLADFDSTITSLLEAAKMQDTPNKFFNFTKVLSQNKRFGLLPEIADLFIDELNKSNETVVARIKTAKPLTDSSKSKLLEKLAAKYMKKVEATIEIDDSLIGGAVIKVGDTVIDGSIKGRLEQLSKALN